MGAFHKHPYFATHSFKCAMHLSRPWVNTEARTAQQPLVSLPTPPPSRVWAHAAPVVMVVAVSALCAVVGRAALPDRALHVAGAPAVAVPMARAYVGQPRTARPFGSPSLLLHSPSGPRWHIIAPPATAFPGPAAGPGDGHRLLPAVPRLPVLTALLLSLVWVFRAHLWMPRKRACDSAPWQMCSVGSEAGAGPGSDPLEGRLGPASDVDRAAAIRRQWMAKDGEHAWLEEVEGEEALAWVTERNAKALEALGDPTGTPLYERVLSILDSKDKIPQV